jgi:hypothetical protein
MTDNKITTPKIEEISYLERQSAEQEQGSKTEKEKIVANSQKLIHLETVSEISEATKFIQDRYNK